jgi:hypothetical protein
LGDVDYPTSIDRCMHAIPAFVPTAIGASLLHRSIDHLHASMHMH